MTPVEHRVEEIGTPLKAVSILNFNRQTIIFLGVLIGVCQGEFILAILALAALRNLGVWQSLDAKGYAYITAIAAIVGFVAMVSYIVFYVRSGKEMREAGSGAV